jgi:two-component system, NtrC family, response regulator AtoC
VTENAIEAVRLLVVSKEPTVIRSLWSIGEMNAWQLETVGSGWEALEVVQAGFTPDLLLLDLPRGDAADSLHILRWLRRLRPELPIILLCYPDDAGRKNEAIRLGAQDYLVRPVTDEQLESVIRGQLSSQNDIIEMDLASEDIEQVSDDAFFVGASLIMRKLRAQAELLAQANVPVLILGENGSGKDTAARLIHKLSVRSGFKFVKVNCAALPGDLLETELFGYERSDSGVARSKPGKLELCEQGTVLLDEITEMPTSVQSKLLQVLLNKQFFRPGSGAAVEVDIRILAASSANIERALAEKKLREDLYYRLSAFTVQAPSLRQRKDEIPLLLRHFMHHLAKHYGMTPRTFSPAVLEACHAYSWPGNLRELEEFVKRYLVMGDKEIFSKIQESGDASEHASLAQNSRSDMADLDGNDNDKGVHPSSLNSLKSLVQSVRSEAERNAITTALEKTGWNRKAAAKLLMVSYRTLLYKIEQYHMSSSEAPPSAFPGNGTRGNGRRI